MLIMPLTNSPAKLPIRQRNMLSVGRPGVPKHRSDASVVSGGAQENGESCDLPQRHHYIRGSQRIGTSSCFRFTAGTRAHSVNIPQGAVPWGKQEKRSAMSTPTKARKLLFTSLAALGVTVGAAGIASAASSMDQPAPAAAQTTPSNQHNVDTLEAGDTPDSANEAPDTPSYRSSVTTAHNGADNGSPINPSNSGVLPAKPCILRSWIVVDSPASHKP